MGTAIIKLKIMPKSPDSDLNEIQEKAKNIISKITSSDINTQKEPIAFGLNALYLIFTIDESQSIDEAQEEISNLDSVSSAEVVDFRRALG